MQCCRKTAKLTIIKQVEEIGGDASAKLFNLFQLAYEDDGQLEKAMRTWAASDARAAAIAWIDQRRLDYLQDLFLQIGFPAVDAKPRARLTLLMGRRVHRWDS